MEYRCRGRASTLARSPAAASSARIPVTSSPSAARRPASVCLTSAEHPLVRLGGEGGERQVLHLPLVVVQPEPLGERHEQLHGRAGDPLALLPLGVVAEGAQVVHPVGELDDEDAQVDRGGEDHLAERLAPRRGRPTWTRRAW